MESKFTTWMLCTSTAVVDYFWIDDHCGTLSRTPLLYGRVADESDERTGYFLVRSNDSGIVEMCVNRLDAQRRDRLGRYISHTLILRAKPGETAKVDFLRKTFAEAITNTVSDPVAAVLARRLHAHWEENQEAPKSHEKSHDWFPLVSDLQPAVPDRNENAVLGMRHPRNTETLTAFAHTALHHSGDNGDVLLLCAATNQPFDVWPIPGYEANSTALCSLNVVTAEKLPCAPREGDARSFLRPALLILLLLAALGIVYLLWPRSSEPQPSPASDTQLTPPVTSPKDRNSAPSSSPVSTQSINSPKNQD